MFSTLFNNQAKFYGDFSVFCYSVFKCLQFLNVLNCICLFSIFSIFTSAADLLNVRMVKPDEVNRYILGVWCRDIRIVQTDGAFGNVPLQVLKC